MKETIKKYRLPILLVVISLILFYFKDKVKSGMEKIISPFKKSFGVSSPFGDRIHPVTKEAQFHNGVDFKTPEGTPVYASFDGLVSTFEDQINGKAMLLTNDTIKRRVGFAHLSSFVAKKGQTVKQGDLIAYTGKTGRVTGAHVHMTLKDTATNKWINPINEIKF